MDFRTFERRALEMWEHVPARFREGVTALIIARERQPDPEFPEVSRLGECAVDEAVAAIPGAPLHSLIMLYHGSFRAVAAEDPTFDWEDELWETITHELRHHLEWRGGLDGLGDEDDLQRENLARRAGMDFDPWFHRGGAAMADKVWSVDGDLFVELELDRATWRRLHQDGVETEWAGIVLWIDPLPAVPDTTPHHVVANVELPLADPEDEEAWIPWDEAVLVLIRKRGWFGFA